MSEDLSQKLAITAALSGRATMKNRNPAVPYTAEEFGEEAKKCYEAGAAIVHIHARDPKTGLPSPDLDIFKAIIDAIKEKAPNILINLSTAISGKEPAEQRIAPIKAFQPDLGSLNSSSMNFAMANWKTGEIIEEFVFENLFHTIQNFAKELKSAQSKPEIEIYDFGGMYNILHLMKQTNPCLDEPLHFQFVFGVLGGVPFSYENLAHFLNIKPNNASWSVCGVARDQFQAGMCAAALGGHIRVGLEDNIRNVDGTLARGSWEQVEWAAKVTKLAGRDIATPNEVRKIFHLYK